MNSSSVDALNKGFSGRRRDTLVNIMLDGSPSAAKYMQSAIRTGDIRTFKKYIDILAVAASGYWPETDRVVPIAFSRNCRGVNFGEFIKTCGKYIITAFLTNPAENRAEDKANEAAKANGDNPS